VHAPGDVVVSAPYSSTGHMRIRSFTRLTTAALVLAAACHDSTGPKDANGFHGSVTGAVNRTLSGEAFGESTTDVDGTEYALVLSDGAFTTSRGGVVFDHFGAPATKGTYQLGDGSGSNEFFGAFASATDQTAYYATSGTLTITSISGTRVAGRFDMQAETDPQATGTVRSVRVTGTFSGDNDGIPTIVSNARTMWRAIAPAQLSRVRGGR
jgi:hypothetical protein